MTLTMLVNRITHDDADCYIAADTTALLRDKNSRAPDKNTNARVQKRNLVGAGAVYDM